MAMQTITISNFEELFLEDLPHKPYCTDELGVTYIRPKATAIKKRYLQTNQPKKHIYLLFDVDYEGGVLSWYDNDCPPPLWTAKNRKNGHAHIAYRLKVPVCTSDIAHLEPLRYLAAIESAMVEKLKADRGFAGLLTKNPLHPHWYTHHWAEYEYTLDELADYLDLRGHPKRRGIEAVGLGRNVELFDTTRKWAYKAIRDHWKPNYRDKWHEAVLSEVDGLNGQFSAPLPYSEVKSIAKSIAKWTYKNFTPAGFSKVQARRGAKGGESARGEVKAKGGKISKGGGRPDKKSLLPNVLALKQDGMSNRAIAKELNLSPSTISIWLKNK